MVVNQLNYSLAFNSMGCVSSEQNLHWRSTRGAHWIRQSSPRFDVLPLKSQDFKADYAQKTMNLNIFVFFQSTRALDTAHGLGYTQLKLYC
jgi:hypothetical protein